MTSFPIRKTGELFHEHGFCCPFWLWRYGDQQDQDDSHAADREGPVSKETDIQQGLSSETGGHQLGDHKESKREKATCQKAQDGGGAPAIGTDIGEGVEDGSQADG